MTKSNALIEQNKTQSKKQLDLVSALKKAAALSGSKPMRIMADWWKLKKKVGALSFEEYIEYRLYDPSYTQEAKEDFVSEKLHWQMTGKACDLSWRAATEDKWLSYEILAKLGHPTPQTIAVADQTSRQYGPTRKLATLEEFVEFATSLSEFPVFAKPNREVGSFGAYLIEGLSGNDLVIAGGEKVSMAEAYDSVFSKTEYLFQKFIHNHSDILKYSKYLATVRTLNIIKDGELKTPFTLLKIPSSKSIADNYWREGNLLANIDPKSGEILRVVSGKGLSVKEHEQHPETGHQLVGEHLPHWSKLLELNEACALTFSPVRYQSMDIAITEAGPVVIEINTGGSFMLPQLASGTGFLTPDVRDFFESCGYTFGKK